MFQDPLAKVTSLLLKSVAEVTKEVNKKKEIILECEQAIKDTQVAINEAKNVLSM